MSKNTLTSSSIKSISAILIILLIFIVPFILKNFNISQETSLTESSINVQNQEIENSKAQIDHTSGKTYEYSNDIIKEQITIENKDNNKVYASYTKDFFDITDSDGEIFLYNNNGSYFGWEERLSAGCSSWCSVVDYNVNVKASSTLKPHGKFSYSPSNIDNVSKDNAWVEGVDGSGIGEYLEIEQYCLINSPEYEADITFTELCLVNGYAALEKNWSENNRVKELKMYFDNKYITTIVLEDIIKQQYIDISEFDLKVQNGETAKFKFEINDVYSGTKYDDTCITGLLIEFSGRTGH